MAPNIARDPRAEVHTLYELSKADKPTIKILLYTDAPRVVTRRKAGAFGLGRMIEHLHGHAPAFARLDVKWISRYPNNSTTADNKLHVVLDREVAKTGAQFDQIWFFGIHQINKRTPDLGLGGGTRESELTADELAALKTWMEQHQGGVLITGDHSNPPPADAKIEDEDLVCPDSARREAYLGLGRALGRCIPRAGQMRDWEGDPTSDRDHSFNTQVSVRGVDINDSGLQRDRSAQLITLQDFDENGRPVQDGEPHPLFFYGDGQRIRFFPDHAHEGAVVVADVSDETIWKRSTEGFQPIPHVVAKGVDSRSGTRLNLVAAYDGSAVNVGRIVADSTWHHYFNVNLENFRHPANPDTPADQIGQFYANLAVWLSPSQKRKQMADSMIKWLAEQPSVLEEFGPVPTEQLQALLSTGGAALTLLKRMASPCEIHELLQMTLSDKRRQQFETHYLPEKQLALSPIPSKGLVLGYLVNRFSQKRRDFSRLALAGEEKLLAATTTAELIGASEQAFRRQRREVTRTMIAAERFSPRPDLSSLAEFRGDVNLKGAQPPDNK